MADKQALNATFFAFRKREKAVLLPATIAYIVLSLVLGVAFLLVNAQAFVDFTTWAATVSASAGKSPETVSPESMMPPASIMALAPAWMLMTIISFVLLAAYEAACLRWMIRGETGGIFGLSLGADTWRVYFTYWIWLLLFILFYIVCVIIMGAGAVSMVAIAGAGGQQPSGAIALIPVVLFLAILCALIFLGVRLAPAAAASVARKRFAFFDAWKVSQGRFWALFGAFLLICVMFLVFYFIAAGILVVASGQALGQLAQPPPSAEALQALYGPQLMIGLVVFTVLMTVASFLLYIAMFGVNARAAAVALEEGKIKAAS